MIRKATKNDIDGISEIIDDIHTAEENGELTIGWMRDVYPTVKTAEDALVRGDIFVLEDENEIIGTAIINQIQVDTYAKAKWEYEVPDDEVMVLHTLMTSPKHSGKGCGRKFVEFYEKYAADNGCNYLRMDTNEKNLRARKMYSGMGYKEIGKEECKFNGIPGVYLILLEKKL